MVNKITGIKMLIVPFAVVISLLAIVFYVKPAYDEMQTLKEKQAGFKGQLENMQKQNKILSELKAKWDTMSGEKLLVDGALPEDENMDNLTAELYERASRSGVLLTDISAKGGASNTKSYVCNTKGGSVVSSTPNDTADGNDTGGAKKKSSAQASSCVNGSLLSLAIVGNWDQTLNFFKYMGDMNRLSNISSVSIKGGEKNQSEGSDLLDTQIGMSVFYKTKSTVGNSSIISSLTGGEGFEEGVIKNLKEIIFAPFVAPSVSESGERNVFK